MLRIQLVITVTKYYVYILSYNRILVNYIQTCLGKIIVVLMTFNF